MKPVSSDPLTSALPLLCPFAFPLDLMHRIRPPMLLVLQLQSIQPILKTQWTAFLSAERKMTSLNNTCSHRGQ
jgi:hypothetical protein